MTAVDLARVYRDVFADQHLELRDTSDPVYRKIVKYITPDRSAAILDAGCGSGRYSLSLMRDGYTNLSAFDITPSAQEHVQDFKIMDLNEERWPYEEKSFDAVIAIASAYYSKDLLATLGQLSRILKKGGVFVSTFHTRYSPHTLDRVLRRKFAAATVPHLNGCRFIPWWQVTRGLKKSGFEVCDVDGYDLIYVPPFLKRFLSRKRNTRTMAVGARKNVFMAERIVPKKIKATLGYHSIIVARKRA